MNKSELIAFMWDSSIPPIAKLVFLAILDYRNSKTGDCYPSMESISSKTGVCRNTVAASIKAIETAGLFSIKKIRPSGSKFTVNSYTFAIHCSNAEQSNEQSVDQSNERSPDGHKPIEPIEPKKVKDKSLTKRESFDYEFFKQTWKEYLPSLPQVERLTDARKAALRNRWDDFEHDEQQWFRVLKKIQQSDWLMGRNDKGFTATFDWVLKPANMAKIIEGNYDNRGKTNGKPYLNGTSQYQPKPTKHERLREAAARGLAEWEDELAARQGGEGVTKSDAGVLL